MTGAARPQALNILLVDADQRTLYGMRDRLARQGRVDSVINASSGAAALERLPGIPPITLALIDIDMPDMDGVETGCLIKRRNPEIAVVLMTAARREEHIQRVMTTRIAGLLHRDMPPGALVDALVSALSVPEDPDGWPVPVLGEWFGQVALSSYRRQALAKQHNAAFLAAIGGLSAKHQKIIGPLILGKPYKEVARDLKLSEQTVRTYGAQVIRLLGCTSRSEVAARAIQSGWTDSLIETIPAHM